MALLKEKKKLPIFSWWKYSENKQIVVETLFDAQISKSVCTEFYVPFEHLFNIIIMKVTLVIRCIGHIVFDIWFCFWIYRLKVAIKTIKKEEKNNSKESNTSIEMPLVSILCD